MNINEMEWPLSKEELKYLYITEEMSMREISKKFNKTRSAARYWIKKLDIPRKTNYFKKQRKTTKEFKNEVKEIVGNKYIVLGEYKNNNTKIKIKHNKCGFIYKVTPGNFIAGNRCPKCSGKRRDTESFKQMVNKKTNGNYKFIDKYINATTKVKFKHLNCGYEYYSTPNNFLSGSRCPKCAGNKKKTTHDFKKQVYKIVGNEYLILSNYKNNRTEIKIKHNRCGHIYKTKPTNFLKGRRCPKCNKFFKKTTKEFKKEIKRITNDKYKIIGNYENAHTKIKIKHLKCGHEYYVRPSNFLKGNRCPECSRLSKTKNEKIISEILKSKNIKYYYEFSFKDCKDEYMLRFDFKIKNKPIVIEYNGIQHYEPVKYFGGKERFKDQQRKDRIKKDYCKENNIKLITIPYWEKDNIEEILEEELQEVI